MERRQPRLSRQLSGAADIAGIDEAGRGCLAGPVVAAAVILPEVCHISGLADSKLLSPPRRERLEILIKSSAISWSVGVVWPRRIEEVNILNATLEAMTKAAAGLMFIPRFLLIDGNKCIPSQIMQSLWPHSGHVPVQRAVIGGDATEKPISAASIIAKTFRDRLMRALDRRYPQYGFARHKGYGTKEHMRALAMHGPCAMHRKTFRGVSSPDQQCL